jgi:hypothetical protein
MQPNTGAVYPHQGAVSQPTARQAQGLRDQGFGSAQARPQGPQNGGMQPNNAAYQAQPGAVYPPQGAAAQPTARQAQGLRDQGFGSAQARPQGPQNGGMQPNNAAYQPQSGGLSQPGLAYRPQQGAFHAAAPQQTARQAQSALRDEGFGSRQSQRQPGELEDLGFGSRRVPRQGGAEGASPAQTGRGAGYSSRTSALREGFSRRQDPLGEPGIRRPTAQEPASSRQGESDSGLIRQHSSRNQEEEPRREGPLSIPLKNSAMLRNPLQFGLIIAGCLLVLALLIFGVVKGIGAIRGAIEGGSQGAAASPPPSAPAESSNVQTGTVNGQPGHIITFEGTDGDVIYIPEPLNQNVTIVGGAGIFQVEDSRLIGDRIVEEAVDVTLQPVLRSASGKDQALPPISLHVMPPDASLEIIAPAGGREEVSLTVYQIRIRVMVGSKVTINGEDVSESISTQADTAGILARNVELQPIGDNDIEIEVSSPGFKTVRKTVQIYLERRAIPISLDVGTPTISNEGTVTISGKVGEGATIKVTSPTVGETVLNSNGSFSFKAKLTKYGENTIEIIASKNGEEDTPFHHAVTYNPDVDSYTRAAYKLDYDNLQNYKGRAQPFRLDGEVETVLSEEPYTFRINAGTSSSPKMIVVEMVEGKRLELGTKYKIYADVIGKTDDGLPLMQGRFFFALN